ncbi:MAG TPA: HEPN domain-containing protein [Stellaceae bacterium]|nr:HEPN domain-containing protein [Stellaceae bacterium]
MNPEVGEHLDKAKDCLKRARVILDAGIGEDAGRNAYLAAFHAAQAFIIARRGRVARTHRGVHVLFHELTASDPALGDLAAFLSRAYELKATADYEVGADADVPLDEASAAIASAEQFVARIILALG